MKFQLILSIAALGAFSFFSACKNDSAASKGAAAETAATSPAATTGDPAVATPGDPVVVSVPTPTAEPAQNAAGVWHYTCSKGCAGGAGAAGNCPKCSAPLGHNQLYHGAPSPAGTPAAATNPSAQAPGTPKVEPPQNAVGVWHYTCPAGCAGGSGASIPCAKCGQKLTHNAIYHQ